MALLRLEHQQLMRQSVLQIKTPLPLQAEALAAAQEALAANAARDQASAGRSAPLA